MRKSEVDELISTVHWYSWFGIIFCVIIGIFALAVGFSKHCISLIGLGFEYILDIISSVLVLWRFKQARKDGGIGGELTKVGWGARQRHDELFAPEAVVKKDFCARKRKGQELFANHMMLFEAEVVVSNRSFM